MRTTNSERVGAVLMMIAAPVAVFLWGAVAALVVFAAGALLALLGAARELAQLRYERLLRPVQDAPVRTRQGCDGDCGLCPGGYYRPDCPWKTGP